MGDHHAGAPQQFAEGWIAGLQLAAISMQSSQDIKTLIQSFAGSHRYVLDYLIEEVLEQQPESLQTFMLQTAILDRLTCSLCDAVTGQENGQATLEMLDHANLFIVPLDNERRWYRYHPLFADLLRQRLNQTQSKQLPVLHCKASEWHEQNGFIDKAIEHALKGKDFERASNLVEDQFGVMYARGDHATLRRWMAAMPEEFIFSKPHLCIIHAWNMFTSGQLDAADHSLHAARKLLHHSTDQALVSSLAEQDKLSEADRMKLLGRADAIQAFLASYGGDVPGTIQYARQALEYLPEQELPWRSAASVALGDAFASLGEMAAANEARLKSLANCKATDDAYLLMIASLKLAETFRQQGKLQQVIDICEQQMKVANESGLLESVVVGWLLAIWGEVLADDLLMDLSAVIQGPTDNELGPIREMLQDRTAGSLDVLLAPGSEFRPQDRLVKR